MRNRLVAGYGHVKDACATRVARAGAVATVAAAGLVEASPSFATETPTETAVKALAEKVGSEGVAIFLIIIAAISSLIAVIVAVTLGIKRIHSFVK